MHLQGKLGGQRAWALPAMRLPLPNSANSEGDVLMQTDLQRWPGARVAGGPPAQQPAGRLTGRSPSRLRPLSAPGAAEVRSEASCHLSHSGAAMHIAESQLPSFLISLCSHH